MNHTPLPWFIDEGADEDSIITNGDYQLIAQSTPENTQLIVTAVNSHFELLEACKEARDALLHIDEAALGFVKSPDGQYAWPIRDELLSRLDAAVTKAKGKEK